MYSTIKVLIVLYKSSPRLLLIPILLSRHRQKTAPPDHPVPRRRLVRSCSPSIRPRPGQTIFGPARTVREDAGAGNLKFYDWKLEPQ